MFENTMRLKNIPSFQIILLTITWFFYSYIFNLFHYSFGLIFSLVYIIYFVFLNTQQKYYVILFTLPFASLFKINSSLPSTLVVLSIIYIFHVVVLKSLKINKLDYLILILLINSQIISIAIFNGNYPEIIPFFINLIFVRVCILDLNNIDEGKKSQVLLNGVLMFSISMTVTIIIANIFPVIPFIVLEEKQIILENIGRFSGLNSDPNYYSQLILIAAALLIAAAFVISSRIEKIIVISILSFLAINGFRSLSKSYALAIVILLILTFIYMLNIRTNFRIYKENYLKILRNLVIILIGVLSIILISVNVVIPLIESRTDSDLLTGRGEIWSNYFQLMILHPEILISGVGVSNGVYFFEKEFGTFYVAHNLYIDFIVEFGILGTSLILLLLRNILFRIIDLIKSPFTMYILILLLTSFSLSLSSNDVLFIIFPLIVLVITKNKTGVKQNEKFSNYSTYIK